MLEKWLKAGPLTLPPTQAKIIQEVHRNEKVTKPQLSALIGHGKTSVANNISKLRSLGLLTRIGSDKTGNWLIKFIPPLSSDIGSK